MSREHGSFILLKNGTVNVYVSKYEDLIERLNREFEKDSNAEYIITQIVGTVDKPTAPVVRCIYNTNLKG